VSPLRPAPSMLASFVRHDDQINAAIRSKMRGLGQPLKKRCSLHTSGDYETLPSAVNGARKLR
jgi:hypothetical protein